MEPGAGRMSRKAIPLTIEQAAAKWPLLPDDVRAQACVASDAFSVDDPAKLLTGGQFNGDHPRTGARRYAIALVAAIRVGTEESGFKWKYTANDLAKFFRVTRISVLNARKEYPKLYEARNHSPEASPEA